MDIRRRTPAWPFASGTTVALACVLQVAWASADPPAANPSGGGASVTLEPAPAPANPRRQRAVFVCQDGGVPVFADRPCGAAVETRSLVIATPASGATASTTPPAPSASTRPRRAAPRSATIAPAAAPGNACATLQRQLDELNDRMRAGYSAREAARLWQRWRDARERLRGSRC